MNLLMLILSNRTLIKIFAVLLGSLHVQSQANEFSDKLNVSGFGTVATATADTESYRFRTDRSQEASANKDGFAFRPLSLVGVQLDFEVTNKLDLVGQFVYREQDEQTLDSITQMAFLRYKFNHAWQIRAGRTGADIFHFSDTRDISIAYPWVKVPTEVYGIVPTRSLDGVDVTYSTPFDDFNLSIKVLAGQAESDFTSSDYRPIRFKDLIGIGIELDSFDWSFSLKHTTTDAANNNPDTALVLPFVQQLQPLWSGALTYADELSIKNARIEYTSLYAERYMGAFHLSAELANIDSTTLGLRHSVNGFVNLSYLDGEHTYYFLTSFAKTDPYYLAEDKPEFPIVPQTQELAFFVEEITNSLAHNQTSISAGWRWDIEEQLALKVQIERTDIKERGAGLRTREGFVVESEDFVAHTLFLALSFSF